MRVPMPMASGIPSSSSLSSASGINSDVAQYQPYQPYPSGSYPHPPPPVCAMCWERIEVVGHPAQAFLSGYYDKNTWQYRSLMEENADLSSSSDSSCYSSNSDHNSIANNSLKSD